MSPKQVSTGLIDDEMANEIIMKLESARADVLSFGFKPKKGEMAAILLTRSVGWKALEIWRKDNRFGLKDWKLLTKEARKEILKRKMRENFNEIFNELMEELWRILEPKVEEILHDGHFKESMNRILEKHDVQV